ncbi:MAG TPA: 5'-3' exonuclease [Propionibacteriaceae bacterium]|nr:5'-3' exonuclease [Propionibacteriaceae bacterium]
MSPRRLLLDTASLYFRAYYGVPTLYAADGTTPVNAVRGLLDIIAKFVRETHPDEVAACWDNDWRPEWRVALIDSYKAHRVAGGVPARKADPRLPIGAGGRGAASGVAEIADAALSMQVPLIAAVLDAAGIATVGADGYEADDVIGTLATNAPGHVDVVTGDRDLFQLVTDDVTVLYVARGISKYETVDDAWLATKYGICGAQYVDYAVLRGDASDGLPGVAGIGEKTAAKLLADHGDLEGVAESETLSPGIAARLGAAADYIGRARQVVAVRTDLPLSGDLSLPREVKDPVAFETLTRELALGSPASRLVDAMRSR